MEDKYKVFPLYASEGMCWANRDETEIYYVCIWTTKEDAKHFHEITLDRAKEIVDAYRKKYAKYFSYT